MREEKRDTGGQHSTGTFAREAPQGFYHPELDVLRFFAFLAVFFHHCFPGKIESYTGFGIAPWAARWLASIDLAGALGVDLFFVLSSYLITELLRREYEKFGKIDVKLFYIRRGLRIWPLYFVFVLFSIFLLPHLFPNDQISAPHRTALLTYTANWSAAMLGYPHSVTSPLWSVSIEEQFYILWPIVILLFGFRRLNKVLVGLFLIAFLTRLSLTLMDVGHPGVWCNTFARLDPIACGALLSVSLGGRVPELGRGIRFLGFFLCVVTWVVTAHYLDFEGNGSLFFYPSIAFASLGMVVFILAKNVRKTQILGNPILVYMGRISYGLYVFHALALEIADQLLVSHSGFSYRILRAAVGLPLTIGIAAVSYTILETPFLRLKTRFTKIVSRPGG